MGTTIETITVTRPMKVIAFTCCAITTFLMFSATASSEWIGTDGWREGLFQQCVNPGAPLPLPFNVRPIPGCHRAHNAGYVRGCAALAIVVILTDFFGTILTGLGLRSTDPNKKYKYYKVAIYTLVLCLIALLLILIIYPVSFHKELKESRDNTVLNGYKVPRLIGSLDFDEDGIPDYEDTDDDNDGILDIKDKDDDNDGIPDSKDDDDDNDGVLDVDDVWVVGPPEDVDDADGDGISDELDNDDDNDGVADHLDMDDDNDGIPDALDNDDDNDGIPDSVEAAMDSGDDDNDGVPDNIDNDDDNDGIPDADEMLDTDGDGVADEYDLDDDNDGILDDDDPDDNNNGIPDEEDTAGEKRVFSYGFGYGVSWASFIMIFLSVVLLICDRESEEIFYKEKQVEDEEEEEEEA
jgi:uncharacterized membrane protein